MRMRRVRSTERRLIVFLALLVAATFPVFASCAEAEDSRPTNDDASVSLPEASATDADVLTGDPVVDGGCDPSESDCVAQQLSCEEAAWCPVPTTVSTRFLLTSVWGSGPKDVWAVGSGGSIAHWDGTAWKLTPTDVKNTFRAVWGTSPTDVWAVSMTDVIAHSKGFASGTASWEIVTPATSAPMASAAQAIWGTSAGDVRIGVRARGVVVPGRGVVYYDQYTLKSEPDGGIRWDAVEGEGDVLGFWGSSPTDLWLVADNGERKPWEKGQILHGTADRGVFSWTMVDSQSTVALLSIWGSSADDIWAVGNAGTMRRMKKGATRWEIVASPTKETLRAVWGTAADDVWVAGDSGTILHFDGTSWKPSVAAFALGKKPDLYGIWGSSKNDVWIVGDGVALHYTGPKPRAEGGGQ